MRWQIQMRSFLQRSALFMEQGARANLIVCARRCALRNSVPYRGVVSVVATLDVSKKWMDFVGTETLRHVIVLVILALFYCNLTSCESCNQINHRQFEGVPTGFFETFKTTSEFQTI